MARVICFLLAALLTPAAVVFSQLQSLETANLRLIYDNATQSFLAPYVARCFENSYMFHHRLWNYTPSEKVTVFLLDYSDYGNAGAKNVPSDFIIVDIAPFSYAYETMPANERINTVMNHEMVHIAAMDKAAGSDRLFRSLFFGKPAATSDNPITIIYDYLSTPRRSAPRWYHEGIAVFLETWMNGGYGRALGAYDEMVFRTMVRDSARFYDPVSLEAEGTRIDFHVGINSYLYGTRFFSYLAYQYGPENLINWVSRADGSKRYFVSQFENVYGISLDREWSRWTDWEHSYQQANLELIRQYPATHYRDISARPLGSMSRAYYDGSTRKLFAAVDFPGEVAHIASIDIDGGQINKICNVKGPALFFVTSLTYDSTTSTIFYTTDNYGWRDLVQVDAVSGQTKMLLKDARIGDLAFDQADKSIWGVRHAIGISTLVRIPHPYKEWNKIYSMPYGRDIYDIDVSPDGKYISAAVAEISGRQSLVLMDVDKLIAGDTTYSTLFDFKNSNPENFAFSPDGRYLYGSSYYTGASNIFRYDLERDTMEAVTNSETGFFRPIPFSSDSLIVFRYTGRGFLPAVIADTIIEDVNAINYLGQQIVDKYPVLLTWKAGSPGALNIDSMTTRLGRYHMLSGMRMVSAYPVAEGYKDHTAVGLRFNFSVPLELHHSDITASYSPGGALLPEERWHLSWNYYHMNWTARFRHNEASFYDLFGPTKVSRKGSSLGLGFKKSLLYDEPRSLDLDLDITGYTGLERLPEFQNITTSFDKFLSANANLGYSNRQASLGAVDFERGHKWQVSSVATYVNKKLFDRFWISLDYGFPLIFHHSSIWSHSSLGYSPGYRREPFANFYFGGFGNNWIDYQTEKRYREYYSFPGVELNAINGTNFGKETIEWTLPPIRFRRLGSQSLYASWLRPAVFVSGIVTNMDSSPDRRFVANAGSQFDLRMTMLSHLNLTFSVGYAIAIEKDRNPSHEFMLSLKVL